MCGTKFVSQNWARRKFLLILYRLKNLLWCVAWPLDPCRSFQRAHLCPRPSNESPRVGLSQWFEIFVSWPLRFPARRARGNSCFWLRSKCHFASRKDILQKGAWNTFNFLHLCPVSTSTSFLLHTHQKVCPWCQQYGLYCPQIIFSWC